MKSTRHYLRAYRRVLLTSFRDLISRTGVFDSGDVSRTLGRIRSQNRTRTCRAGGIWFFVRIRAFFFCFLFCSVKVFRRAQTVNDVLGYLSIEKTKKYRDSVKRFANAQPIGVFHRSRDASYPRHVQPSNRCSRVTVAVIVSLLMRVVARVALFFNRTVIVIRRALTYCYLHPPRREP